VTLPNQREFTKRLLLTLGILSQPTLGSLDETIDLNFLDSEMKNLVAVTSSVDRLRRSKCTPCPFPDTSLTLKQCLNQVITPQQ